MQITFSQKILIILFLVLAGFVIILHGINAYSDPPTILWCFSTGDCENPICQPSTYCPDDRPGYDAQCEPATGWVCTTGFCLDKTIQSCLYIAIPTCECSGAGWHDAPFWGGCGDCTTNPLYPNENCEPCGSAYAYCDGCNWDTSGWKCAGSPKICTPNSDRCEGQYALHCLGTGCSESSYDCGTSGCVGNNWHDRGCSGGGCYDNVSYNDSRCCDCYGYGTGWHDAPFWGGCGDCTSNSINNCTPCGEALAYCDSCNWNTSWWPFVNDNDSWSTSGHKCPGSPKTCTPSSSWCSGSVAWHCNSNGCSQSSVDCGSDYWTNEYRCIGTMQQRKYVSRGCSGGGCYSNDIWYNWSECGSDYWGSSYSCSADAVWRTRQYFSRGCSGTSCYLTPSYQNWENCNNYDGWYSGQYRNYYCSVGTCVYVGATAPNTPTSLSPCGGWLNSNPTLSATVSDPDGGNVRAYFNILSYADYWGNWVSSGGTSSYGPINFGNCASYWWRAFAQDPGGLTSNLSGSCSVNVDKNNPTAAISYPTGTYTSLTFTMSLTESDACSGIAAGDVDIKIKPSGGGWGNWQDYSATISDFNYTGVDKYTYKFRYRTKDNANNWSNFTEGGEIFIDLNDPPTATCKETETWNSCVDSRNPALSWNYSDPEGDSQGAYQIQIDSDSAFSAPITINATADPSSSGTYQPSGTTLNWGTRYYWRVKVKDNQGAWSNWCSPICSFDTPVHAYPNVGFSWAPTRVSANDSVFFSDTSTCYDGSGSCSAFSWDFDTTNLGQVLPFETSILENPKVSFSNPGDWQIKLEVTDKDGFKCPLTKSVRVSWPLPKWDEIIPK